MRRMLTTLFQPGGGDRCLKWVRRRFPCCREGLKLGYSRAARLVDQMEEKGIVGPFEGSKPRQVLITKQQWQEMQFVTGTAPTTPKAGSLEPGQTMQSADDLFEDD